MPHLYLGNHSMVVFVSFWGPSITDTTPFPLWDISVFGQMSFSRDIAL